MQARVDEFLKLIMTAEKSKNDQDSDKKTRQVLVNVINDNAVEIGAFKDTLLSTIKSMPTDQQTAFINRLKSLKLIQKSNKKPAEYLKDDYSLLVTELNKWLDSWSSRAIIENLLTSDNYQTRVKGLEQFLDNHLADQNPFDPFAGERDIFTIIDQVVKKENITDEDLSNITAIILHKAKEKGNSAIAVLEELGLLKSTDANHVVNSMADEEMLTKLVMSNVKWSFIDKKVIAKIDKGDIEGFKEYLDFHIKYGLPDKEYSTVSKVIESMVKDINNVEEVNAFYKGIYEYVINPLSAKDIKEKVRVLDDFGFFIRDNNEPFQTFLSNGRCDLRLLSDAFKEAQFRTPTAMQLKNSINVITSFEEPKKDKKEFEAQVAKLLPHIEKFVEQVTKLQQLSNYDQTVVPLNKIVIGLNCTEKLEGYYPAIREKACDLLESYAKSNNLNGMRAITDTLFILGLQSLPASTPSYFAEPSIFKLLSAHIRTETIKKCAGSDNSLNKLFDLAHELIPHRVKELAEIGIGVSQGKLKMKDFPTDPLNKVLEAAKEGKLEVCQGYMLWRAQNDEPNNPLDFVEQHFDILKKLVLVAAENNKVDFLRKAIAPKDGEVSMYRENKHSQLDEKKQVQQLLSIVLTVAAKKNNPALTELVVSISAQKEIVPKMDRQATRRLSQSVEPRSRSSSMSQSPLLVRHRSSTLSESTQTSPTLARKDSSSTPPNGTTQRASSFSRLSRRLSSNDTPTNQVINLLKNLYENDFLPRHLQILVTSGMKDLKMLEGMSKEEFKDPRIRMKIVEIIRRELGAKGGDWEKNDKNAIYHDPRLLACERQILSGGKMNMEALPKSASPLVNNMVDAMSKQVGIDISATTQATRKLSVSSSTSEVEEPLRKSNAM